MGILASLMEILKPLFEVIWHEIFTQITAPDVAVQATPTVLKSIADAPTTDALVTQYSGLL
jgi:hypothetical protein